ncbi:hypothetical protein D9M68_736710 [compost metagenome]
MRRALRWRLLFVGATLGATLLLGLLSRANAAGGAYQVDDAAINPAGECNVDAWHQRGHHKGRQYRSVLAPACTFSALPDVQLGAALARERDGESRYELLSPELKTLLLSRGALGLAVALAASADFVLDRSHAVEAAGLTLPLTYQPGESLRLNANLGWGYARDEGERNHRWRGGLGFEYTAADVLSLVAERFGEQRGSQGWQAGPRLLLAPALDLDLVLGRQLDAGRDRWLVTGATLRF